MEKLGPGDPQRIGSYRLLARLGAGGMGQVYVARSDRGRTVAVKLVREELAAQDEFRARFRQEVEAARRVGGYWTAPVLDADTEAAVPWVATGYVAGPTLQQVVGQDHGALPERSVRILAAGLAHALGDIHAAGIVHRDLKPSNVLVTIDGPRVIDFGIARALETVTDGGLTRTGALVGSPGFMAPEQVRGDRITPACDIFCLGSVLAYAATGRLPFGTANSGVHALMFRIAQEEPDLEGVPEGIADLVRACLRKDPTARPSLRHILDRTGAQDTVSGGRSRDPWLPSALVAQLGRHAVRLLDAEDPEGEGASGVPGRSGAPDDGAVPDEGPDSPGPGSGPGSGSAAPPGVPAPAPAPAPAPSPEHAPAADDSAPAASPGPPVPGRPGGGTRLDHLPTLVTGPGGPTPQPGQGAPPAAGTPAHPAYGYPQQHPQPSAYGHPQQPGTTPWAATPSAPSPYTPHGSLGSTPPYGPPPLGPPYGPTAPQEPPHRNARSTALLVLIALVVALAAGGSVYALMSGGDAQADGTPSPSASTSANPDPTTPEPASPASPTPSRPTTPAPADGAIPAAYLGTWNTTINNEDGRHTRRLTLRQGEVGDTVLSLVADGPTAGGLTYHCLFEADLAEAPSANGPLRIGPSTMTNWQPRSPCGPGEATEITLLPDGRLQRVNTTTNEKLTYTRQ
ncbi:serine/threonine protein kinase [Streptomyces sp. SA15]|uniref:serine/threonine-protein kinase n=1 Tax=Streptomyces sp. SA15 TaxID=934019 RepID=UPI000BAE88F7|nr:serine/threonine-protein kinase [Streptomyces sp. SA15]PAZ13891.1 serine/threonine protein kinase [Streptomyces sp. SA15]